MLAAAAVEPEIPTMEHASIAEEAQAAAPPKEETIVGSGEVDQNATGSSGASGNDELPPPSPPTPDDDGSSSKGETLEVDNSPQPSPAETEDTTTTTTTTTLTTAATSTTTTTSPGDTTSSAPPPPAGVEEEEAPSPAGQPVQPGDPRWAYSSDRPPAKLPIYFHDAVGRDYTFPWEKAKTWEGMERLIKACFAHVTPVTWWVNQGRYDLKVVEPGSPDAASAVPAMTGIASQMFTTVVAPPPPVGGTEAATASTGAGAGAGNSFQSPVLPQQQPAAGTGAPFLQTVILPELWDDLVVPGMTVTMTMW
ncbi:hypothetical protein PG996_002355 [Apiospora saccharicola]|uniref:Ubiquitin-like domain-containing protein n=1 Tax=Apiospora saccharicola TaxID=335842 RepID=A0ABR1WJ92_9PEZI